MRLYDSGIEGFLTGKVAVKGSGGYACCLNDIPQRRLPKAFLQELGSRRGIDFFKCGLICLTYDMRPSNGITLLYNSVIISQKS